MKKGIIFITCLLAVNMAFSQTWSHTKYWRDSKGVEHQEKLYDVKDVQIYVGELTTVNNSMMLITPHVTKEEAVVISFLNVKGSSKHIQRHTPTITGFKPTSDGGFTQSFKRDGVIVKVEVRPTSYGFVYVETEDGRFRYSEVFVKILQ